MMESKLTDEQSKPAPSAQAPSAKTALLIGIAPAIVVAIALIVGVLFFNNPEANRAQPSAASAQPSDGGVAVEDHITALMQRYVDALIAGDSTMFKSTLCQRVTSQSLDFQDSPPLEDDLPQLDDVTVLSATDSAATATVTVSVKDAPDLGSKTTQLQFIDEDGWKLC